MEILRPLFVLFVFCGLLILVTYLFRFAFNYGRRFAMLQAFVTLGGVLWLITEVLSVFKAITLIGLTISWGVVYLISLAMLMRVSGGNVRNAIFADLRGIRISLMSLPRGLLAVSVLTFVGVLILGLIAFAGAPNTWDSMTYHLSRVRHWEQNRSLAFYPTSINRQLHLGPLAEMFILNFQVFAGNDRLANFVQFFAMIGCVLGVSLIAKNLGGNVYAQVFSSLAAATLPMGILQSTSTQNDHVVSLWLVCFVLLTLAQLREEKPLWIPTFLAGISLGLAILTKVTVLIFGASFGLWFAFGLVLRFQAKAWKQMTILLCTTLLIVVPHGFRNYKLYGNPLGPMSEAGGLEYRYTNDTHDFSVLTSNLLRNTAIHLALPFERLNDRIYGAIWRIHAFLERDVNDPGTTWPGTEFRVLYSTNENLAGNPFHLLLVGVSILFLATRRGRSQLVVFTLCLIAGFLLFSWLLKWQPWHSRLHLPLFVLAMSLVGVVLSGRRERWVLYAMVIVLSVFSYKYLFLNPIRPLLGERSVLTTDRLEQYFNELPAYFSPYRRISEAIGDLQCNDIGLVTNIDDWEYPLWVMTDVYDRDIRFEHILVDNPSGKLDTGFAPCAIILTRPLQEEPLIYQNKVFVKFREMDQLSLFILPAR